MSYSALARHWGLDPSFVFLNHGSFGATPVEILDQQTRLRRRLENQPVRFMERELAPLLAEAKQALGEFVGARADDLAVVTNATTGVNAVLRSLDLRPGDELLTTTHEYNAVQNALEFVAARSGARVVVAEIPFPIDNPKQAVDAVLARVSERTKLAVLYHVSSPTALVMPIAETIAALNERGVDTLVDGAHAPGMVDLDLDALGAAYYTGNCHKWMCAPKGVAFLHVRRDRAERVRPTVISHGANAPGPGSRFQLEFDWQGTFDPTGWLVLPDVIGYLDSLVDGGWPELRRRNHALAARAQQILCNTLELPPPCPASMLGAMAAVALPDDVDAPRSGWAAPLKEELYQQHHIEVPVLYWPAPPRRLLRISAQLYNTEAQYQQLADAVAALLRRD